MSRNELPVDGNWEAVHAAVRRLMRGLDMSTARLSRESGVSETTIRYLRRPEKRQRSTLVALAAALGCQHDYLVDVLVGEADPGEAAPGTPSRPSEKSLPMKDMLDGLGVTLQVMEGKMEMIFRRQ